MPGPGRLQRVFLVRLQYKVPREKMCTNCDTKYTMQQRPIIIIVPGLLILKFIPSLKTLADV